MIDLRMHANRRAVDEDVTTTVTKLFDPGGDDSAGSSVEFARQRLRFAKAAVVDHHRRAKPRQRRHGGARRPAGTDYREAKIAGNFIEIVAKNLKDGVRTGI